jgi:GNAT superfamily N-acetyltransferase
MTRQWRERTLRAPLYQPGLDLVAVAPDGTLAGFCVGWHEPSRGIAQVEPAGVHPRYQRRGLARALLTEMAPPAPPGTRGHPPTLERPGANRPWRAAEMQLPLDYSG